MRNKENRSLAINILIYNWKRTLISLKLGAEKFSSEIVYTNLNREKKIERV